jgi:hypothetical protein
MRLRRSILATAAVVVGFAATPAEASAKACQPVVDIFDGSRYAGTDLYRIRAEGVSCKTARRVALRGSYRGVAAVPDPDGRVRVSYRRWSVIGDLRDDVDRYRASAGGGKRVRWVLGDLG